MKECGRIQAGFDNEIVATGKAWTTTGTVSIRDE